MKKQLQGITILLLSILLILGFNSVGWHYVFDLSLEWQHIFMASGIVGAIIAFLPDKKGR